MMESSCIGIIATQGQSARIRPARKEEWPSLIAIWEKTVRETHGFLAEDDFAEIKSQMPDYLGAVELFVWDEGEGPAGFLGLLDNMVEMLFVADRGKGIGRKLLDFAVAEKGATRLDVNEQNAQARGFYEKYGFAVSGRSEFDTGGRPYPLLHMELKQTK